MAKSSLLARTLAASVVTPPPDRPVKADPTRFIVGRHGRKGHVVVYGVKGEKYGKAAR